VWAVVGGMLAFSGALAGAEPPPAGPPGETAPASVEFVPRPPTDAPARYRLTCRTELTEGGRAAVIYELDAVLNVRGVERGASGMVVGVEVERVTLTRTAGTETVSAVAPAAEGDAPPAGATPAEDRSTLRQLADALVAAKIRVEATPFGRVTDVLGLRDVYGAAREVGRDGSIALQGLAPGSAARTFTLLFQVDEPGEAGSMRPRRAGETWTIDRTYRLPMDGTMNASAKVVFDALAGDEATLTITGTSEVKRAEGAGEGVLRAKVRPRTETERVVWDTRRGQLIRRSAESAVDTTVTAGTDAGKAEASASVRTSVAFELLPDAETAPKPSDSR
jgi:hypothetical protein